MLRGFMVRLQTFVSALALLVWCWHNTTGHPQTDNSLLSQAAELASRKNWSESEALTRQYLQKQPESADGHALLGFILFNQHEVKESMAEYVEAAQQRDLTASELKTFALDCAELHLFMDADKWLTRSLEMNPGDAKGWEALGNVKFEEQRYQEAITIYKRSLSLAPRSVSAETGIALSFEMLSQLDNAKDSYRTAISWETQRPRDPAPYNGFGRILLKQNKPADALPYLLRAVELGPTVARAHEELGMAYSSLNQIPAAQKQIQKAIELAPKVARLHYVLGQLYRKSGQLDKAKTELESFTALVGTSSTPASDPK